MNVVQNQKTILVAAPLGFQLTPLSKRLGRFENLEIDGQTVRKFWFLGSTVLLHKSGYGRKVAAVSMRKAVDSFKPDHVLFCNVAGGLKPDYSVGDPFLVSSASLWAGQSITLSIEKALGLKPTYEYFQMPLISRVKGGKKVRRARLLSVDQFVNSIQEKRKLGVSGYDLVDMEFAAVAQALSGESEPELTSLVVVSDTLHQQFPRYQPDNTQESLQQSVPPKLKINMKKATQSLGGFAHLWLRTLIQGKQS